MPLTTQDRMYVEQRIQNDAKSPLVAYVLWFFLGAVGAHRLYLGRSGSGLLMALLFVIGIVTAAIMVGFALLFILGVWWLWDAISIPSMIDRQKRTLRQRLETQIADPGAEFRDVDTSKWSASDRAQWERKQALVEPKPE